MSIIRNQNTQALLIATVIYIYIYIYIYIFLKKNKYYTQPITWRLENHILFFLRNAYQYTNYSIIYIYIYIYIYHHHVMRLARISLTLTLHVSLSFIASGRSSVLHPVSSHSCCTVCSSWSSCFWLAICGGPQEYITNKLVLASPCLFLPGLVQYCS